MKAALQDGQGRSLMTADRLMRGGHYAREQSAERCNNDFKRRRRSAGE